MSVVLRRPAAGDRAAGDDGASDEGAAAVDLARALLDRGQSVRFVARGQSMWPAILDGDRLTLAPRAGVVRADTGQAEPVRLGAVVFLPTADFGVAHRVVARFGPWCCLKGDAAVAIDGWFRAEQLVARVVAVERDGRAVVVRETVGAVLASWVQGGLRALARQVRGG